ncbi:MAG: nuclear transport factor 2 family protein [Gemmatimonadetes bacterium]|nr:nuclear transport factor 2 family protein [Gemmatimonadota bacterium]
MSAVHPVIAGWHAIVAARDPRRLEAWLHDDVTFISPVVHTPKVGKREAIKFLSAALHVLGVPGFRYVREIVGERDACLEFVVELDGIVVNGVDLIHWNDAGQVTEFKVMVRPLKGLQQVQAKMLALLGPPPVPPPA